METTARIHGWWRICGALLVITLLLSCYASERTLLAENTSATVVSGIGGTGVTASRPGDITALGIIQGFGSIIVNGRKYELYKDTRVSINGLPATQQDLRVGDMVVVKAALPAGSIQAQSLEIQGRHAVQGLVEHIDADFDRFTVLGQEIKLNESSVIENARGNALKLHTLAVGDLVTVSALPRAEGRWIATRVTRLEPGDTLARTQPFLLRGNVNAFSNDRAALRIGTQSVNLSDARLPQDVQVGKPVLIRGHYINGAPRASFVEVDVVDLGKPGDRVEIAGYLQPSRPRSGQLLSNGITLRYEAAATVRESMLDDLRPDRLVALQGVLRRDGSVTVDRVSVDVTPERPTPSQQPAPQTEPDSKDPQAAATQSDGTASGTPNAAGNTQHDIQGAQSATRDDGASDVKSKGAAPIPEQPAIQPPTRDISGAEKPAPEVPTVEKPATDVPAGDIPKIDIPDVQKPDVEKPDTEKPAVDKLTVEKPDVEKPDVEKPDVEKPDIEKPDVEKPDIEKPDIEKPDIEKPDIEKPDIEKPDIEKPDIEKPDIEKPDVERPDIEKPDVERPDVERPDIEKPDVERPDVERPDVEKPDVVRPDVERPDVEKPDVVRPDVERPDIEKPDVEKPDVEKPDVEKPEG